MVSTLALNTDLLATSYAKVIIAGQRTIESVPEKFKVLVYVKLIQANYMTIDEVPENYKTDVQNLLAAQQATETV